jgi:Animal haem peroxidase
MRRLKLQNVLYSFGIAHPGAITLHNYPRSLQRFERLIDGAGEIIDLSVVDIVRDRRRGVPRFNEFRAALHKPRIRRWEDLSDDPETVRRMRDLYRSIDMVDTMVGLHAEPLPAGFGFSDTAFRIFILMASRRLQSDRFLTVDYRPEIYSPLGLDWVDKNTMTSIILRHCPELSTVLPPTASAFAPFRPIAC